MPSDSDIRKPYGPGWEERDWSADASAPEDPANMFAARFPATLSEFMENLRRVAVPMLRAANARRLIAKARRRMTPKAGRTRRWVVAGGASLLAVGTFALPRPARAPEAATRPASPVAAPSKSAGTEREPTKRR